MLSGSNPHQPAVISSTGGSAALPSHGAVISSHRTLSTLSTGDCLWPSPSSDRELPLRPLKPRLCIGWFGRQVSPPKDVVWAGQDGQVMIQSSNDWTKPQLTSAHTSLLHPLQPESRLAMQSRLCTCQRCDARLACGCPRVDANETRLFTKEHQDARRSRGGDLPRVIVQPSSSPKLSLTFFAFFFPLTFAAGAGSSFSASAVVPVLGFPGL